MILNGLLTVEVDTIQFGMSSMMVFTIAPIFISLVAILIIFGGVTAVLRHRRFFDRISDQIERSGHARRAFRQEHDSADEWETDERDAGDYSCQNCGAGLDAGNEISPSGDFKCHYCNTWNNVNQ